MIYNILHHCPQREISYGKFSERSKERNTKPGDIFKRKFKFVFINNVDRISF